MDLCRSLVQAIVDVKIEDFVGFCGVRGRNRAKTIGQIDGCTGLSYILDFRIGVGYRTNFQGCHDSSY